MKGFDVLRSYNFNEVLKIVTEEIGISLETLSLCSGIPIESLNDPLFEIKQKDKARDLLLIMTPLLTVILWVAKMTM